MSEINPNKYVLNITMDEAPHLTADKIEYILAEYAPWERDARRKGIPHLGSGAVYPISEEEIVCPWFEIPDHWHVALGLDVGLSGGSRTAAVWGAKNPDTGIIYIYNEYLNSYVRTKEHADNILEFGTIPAAMDCAGNTTSNNDLKSVRDIFLDCGFGDIFNAQKAIGAGIMKCWQGLASGKIKIFNHCHNFLSEFRVYRYENGKPFKDKDGEVRDDIMDSFRYLIMSFDDISKPKFLCKPGYNEEEFYNELWDMQNNDDAGRSDIGGY